MRVPPAGHGGGASQPPHRPRGYLHEISEGTNGHECRLPRGGLVSRGGRYLRHHRQDGQAGGGQGPGRRGGSGADEAVAHNYDDVGAIIAERVERTDGRITAKRLLPVVRAAGYSGSARNLRRAVAEAKAKWRMNHHRGRRPGVWAPGDVLVFDWGQIGPLYVFCAVLAWSRFRFVSFSDNLGAQATMAALAECMETIGAVPKTLLTDRMGCLKGATVAGLAVPTPDYVRFVTHYGRALTSAAGRTPSPRAWSSTWSAT